MTLRNLTLTRNMRLRAWSSPTPPVRDLSGSRYRCGSRRDCGRRHPSRNCARLDPSTAALNRPRTRTHRGRSIKTRPMLTKDWIKSNVRILAPLLSVCEGALVKLAPRTTKKPFQRILGTLKTSNVAPARTPIDHVLAAPTSARRRRRGRHGGSPSRTSVPSGNRNISTHRACHGAVETRCCCCCS